MKQSKSTLAIGMIFLAFLVPGKEAFAQVMKVTNDSLFSKVLNEQRMLQVMLPENFDSSQSIKYDVLYVTDAEMFQHYVAQIIALQKLKDNEANLLAAEKIAGLGYWQLNKDGQSLYWSNEVYNIWGVSKDSFRVSYQSFFETMHPEDLETFAKIQAGLFAGDKELDFEHRIILPDDSVKWVHEKGKLLKDEHGNPIFFEGSVQDITERKKSDIKLKEAIAQQSLFVSIVNSSEAPLSVKHWMAL